MMNLIGKRSARNFARILGNFNSNLQFSTTPARQFLFDRFPFPPSWYFDPFRQMVPHTHRFPRPMNPFAMLDHFFDDNFNFQVRDNAAKVNINEAGELTYQVNISGFHPNELSVEMEGDDIVIQGEHKEQKDAESVHRKFIRRFRIPEGIQKDTIKCEIDPKGFLTVTAKSAAVEGGAERKSIPIDVKTTTEAKSVGDK